MFLFLRTLILFPIIYWLLSHSLFLFIPVFFMRKSGKKEKADLYSMRMARRYARTMIGITGTKIVVEGEENLPDSKNICIVSNHQALADILTLLATMPFPIGFIAKKELLKMPFLSPWMKNVGCFFIDRKSLRSGMEAISNGVKSIKDGHPMVIFPEGTRSKGTGVGEFKKGSLKLATKSKAVIVPISLDGTYSWFEEKMRITKTVIRVKIHPAVDTSKLDEEAEKGLTESLNTLIRDGWTELKEKNS